MGGCLIYGGCVGPNLSTEGATQYTFQRARALHPLPFLCALSLSLSLSVSLSLCLSLSLSLSVSLSLSLSLSLSIPLPLPLPLSLCLSFCVSVSFRLKTCIFTVIQHSPPSTSPVCFLPSLILSPLFFFLSLAVSIATPLAAGLFCCHGDRHSVLHRGELVCGGGGRCVV